MIKQQNNTGLETLNFGFEEKLYFCDFSGEVNYPPVRVKKVGNWYEARFATVKALPKRDYRTYRFKQFKEMSPTYQGAIDKLRYRAEEAENGDPNNWHYTLY